MNYENLQQDIYKNVKEIDNFIMSNILIADPILQNASRHLFTAGGKRIRPYVFRNSFQTKKKWDPKYISIAASLEILHTFTLLHDDIMDNDQFRRGIPTVHVKWGENMAILAGDALQALVFSLLSQISFSASIRTTLMGDFAQTLIKICEGQSLDISFETDDKVSIEQYLEMVKLKTGELLSLSARAGMIAAEGTSEEIETLSNFGLHYGIAFQIVDDILGISADEAKLGKPVGSDIRQGKKTILTLFALNHASLSDQKRFCNILKTKSNNEGDIQFGIELIQKTGALANARAVAQEFTQLSIKDLDKLPDSTGKRNLIQLAEYSLNRGF